MGTKIHHVIIRQTISEGIKVTIFRGSKNKAYYNISDASFNRLSLFGKSINHTTKFRKSAGEILIDISYRSSLDSYPVSQEEEITCPHCHSEKLEYRSIMVACATMREPAEYEGWFYCWECGEKSEAGE